MRTLLALALLPLAALAGNVNVNWTNPTQYTDGSTLNSGDISQSRVEYGSCNGSAFGTVIGQATTQGAAGSLNLTLPPATYCFRVYTTAKGVESAASNVATKTIVQPAPKPPVLVTVEEIAYEIKPNGLVKMAGRVSLGVPCRSTTQVIAGVVYTELDPATVTFKPGNRPEVVWGKCEEQT